MWHINHIGINQHEIKPVLLSMGGQPLMFEKLQCESFKGVGFHG